MPRRGWLADQVALVTGGGAGLGRAIVERFVAEEARVGVLDLSPKAIAGLGELGPGVLAHRGDATTFEANEAAVAATVEAFDRLDVLVANAGMWDFCVSLQDMPGAALSDAFDELFTLNVKAALLAAKAALPALRASRGSIVFTLSNAAFTPGGGGALYTASKHALVGVVRQLAYELAPEVRVNGVAPGGMATAIRGPRALGLADASWADEQPVDALLKRFSPLDLAPQPEDYTGHYVLLASRENTRTTTGAIHVCDGGTQVRGRREDEELVRRVVDEG